jgi:hypothetical protein
MSNITVSFVDSSLSNNPYTRWKCGNKVVIHDPASDAFLCLSATGELLEQASSLQAAMDWLTR